MKTNIRGFTLIEMMIAVAILGILAAIAVPNYLQHITKGKRAEAQGALVAFANAMEQWRLQCSSYCGTVGGACGSGCATGSPAIFPTTVPSSGGTVTYNLTVFEDPSGTSYKLTATPTGSQFGDGFLELTDTGTKTCENASACLNGSSW